MELYPPPHFSSIVLALPKCPTQRAAYMYIVYCIATGPSKANLVRADLKLQGGIADTVCIQRTTNKGTVKRGGGGGVGALK